jgi:hypothetical protein
MYCPRCAAQNPDETKFCRACGTNLEAVSLALSDPDYLTGHEEEEEPETAKSWIEKRREGTDNIVKGAGWLTASLVIGGALGLFSNAHDWIIIWMAMAGWMACWGIISITSGIRSLLEARFMLRYPGHTASAIPQRDTQELTAKEQAMLPDALAARTFSPPLSVTENTTEPLVKHDPASKRAS